MVLEGRLPSNTRCGTSQSGVPSALTCSRLPESERLGLREYVRQQHIVMAAEPVERMCESDEVTRDEPSALMDQLIERVLAVGSRLAPVDGTGLTVHRRSSERYVFAVALHRQLLEIGREALKVLVVRQHGDRLRAEEIVVPDAEETHQHRQVARERRAAEMFVDRKIGRASCRERV